MAGEVGYISASIKAVADARVGRHHHHPQGRRSAGEAALGNATLVPSLSLRQEGCITFCSGAVPLTVQPEGGELLAAGTTPNHTSIDPNTTLPRQLGCQRPALSSGAIH